ncbi:MAG: hypothetical protein RLZZ371_1972 [Pseudomonadota bacterium]
MTQPGFLKNVRLALFAVPMTFWLVSAQAACQVRSISSITIASYDVFSTSPTDGTGSFKVNGCTTNNTPFTAQLSTGGGTATFAARTLTKSTEILYYNLYKDSARTIVWGDGTGGTSTVSGTGSNGSSTSGTAINIYLRIPAEQDVSAGTYTDSITITISF